MHEISRVQFPVGDFFILLLYLAYICRAFNQHIAKPLNITGVAPSLEPNLLKVRALALSTWKTRTIMPLLPRLIADLKLAVRNFQINLSGLLNLVDCARSGWRYSGSQYCFKGVFEFLESRRRRR